MLSPFKTIGPDEIITLAVSPPAVAVSVSVAVPVGGTNTV